jgi:phosphoglycerate dehydrogenase-like enzyme
MSMHAGIVATVALRQADIDRIVSRAAALGAQLVVRPAPTHQALNEVLDAVPDAEFALADMLPDVGIAPDQGTIGRLDVVGTTQQAETDPSGADTRLQRLRWVQLTAAGVNQETGSSTWRNAPNVAVTTASGLASVAMAQYIVGVILRHANRFDRLEVYREVRDWSVRPDFQAQILVGRTLGLLGYGGTARRAAHIAYALGMRVLAVHRSGADRSAERYRLPAVEERDAGQDPATLLHPGELESVLAESDYLACTLPLTAETRGLIGRHQFALLKPSAVFINVSRGGVVDELALIEALRTRRLAGAALDVFWSEPLPPASPLWDLSNVMLTPHSSGTHDHVSEFTADLFLANLERFLRGGSLLNLAERERGY